MTSRLVHVLCIGLLLHGLTGCGRKPEVPVQVEQVGATATEAVVVPNVQLPPSSVETRATFDEFAPLANIQERAARQQTNRPGTATLAWVLGNQPPADPKQFASKIVQFRRDAATASFALHALMAKTEAAPAYDRLWALRSELDTACNELNADGPPSADRFSAMFETPRLAAVRTGAKLWADEATQWSDRARSRLAKMNGNDSRSAIRELEALTAAIGQFRKLDGAPNVGIESQKAWMAAFDAATRAHTTALLSWLGAEVGAAPINGGNAADYLVQGLIGPDRAVFLHAMRDVDSFARGLTLAECERIGELLQKLGAFAARDAASRMRYVPLVLQPDDRLWLTQQLASLPAAPIRLLLTGDANSGWDTLLDGYESFSRVFATRSASRWLITHGNFVVRLGLVKDSRDELTVREGGEPLDSGKFVIRGNEIVFSAPVCVRCAVRSAAGTISGYSPERHTGVWLEDVRIGRDPSFTWSVRTSSARRLLSSSHVNEFTAFGGARIARSRDTAWWKRNEKDPDFVQPVPTEDAPRAFHIAVPAFGDLVRWPVSDDDQDFTRKVLDPLNAIAAAARRDLGGQDVEVRFDSAAGILEYRASLKTWAQLLKNPAHGLRTSVDQAGNLGQIAKACEQAARTAPDVVLPIRVNGEGTLEPGSAPLKSRDAVVLLNEMRKTWNTAFARCLFIDQDAAPAAEPDGFTCIRLTGTPQITARGVRFQCSLAIGPDPTLGKTLLAGGEFEATSDGLKWVAGKAPLELDTAYGLAPGLRLSVRSLDAPAGGKVLAFKALIGTTAGSGISVRGTLKNANDRLSLVLDALEIEDVNGARSVVAGWFGPELPIRLDRLQLKIIELEKGELALSVSGLQIGDETFPAPITFRYGRAPENLDLALGWMATRAARGRAVPVMPLPFANGVELHVRCVGESRRVKSDNQPRGLERDFLLEFRVPAMAAVAGVTLDCAIPVARLSGWVSFDGGGPVFDVHGDVLDPPTLYRAFNLGLFRELLTLRSIRLFKPKADSPVEIEITTDVSLRDMTDPKGRPVVIQNHVARGLLSNFADVALQSINTALRAHVANQKVTVRSASEFLLEQAQIRTAGGNVFVELDGLLPSPWGPFRFQGLRFEPDRGLARVSGGRVEWLQVGRGVITEMQGQLDRIEVRTRQFASLSKRMAELPKPEPGKEDQARDRVLELAGSYRTVLAEVAGDMAIPSAIRMRAKSAAPPPTGESAFAYDLAWLDLRRIKDVADEVDLRLSEVRSPLQDRLMLAAEWQRNPPLKQAIANAFRSSLPGREPILPETWKPSMILEGDSVGLEFDVTAKNMDGAMVMVKVRAQMQPVSAPRRAAAAVVGATSLLEKTRIELIVGSGGNLPHLAADDLARRSAACVPDGKWNADEAMKLDAFLKSLQNGHSANALSLDHVAYQHEAVLAVGVAGKQSIQLKGWLLTPGGNRLAVEVVPAVPNAAFRLSAGNTTTIPVLGSGNVSPEIEVTPTFAGGAGIPFRVRPALVQAGPGSPWIAMQALANGQLRIEAGAADDITTVVRQLTDRADLTLMEAVRPEANLRVRAFGLGGRLVSLQYAYDAAGKRVPGRFLAGVQLELGAGLPPIPFQLTLRGGFAEIVRGDLDALFTFGGDAGPSPFRIQVLPRPGNLSDDSLRLDLAVTYTVPGRPELEPFRFVVREVKLTRTGLESGWQEKLFTAFAEVATDRSIPLPVKINDRELLVRILKVGTVRDFADPARLVVAGAKPHATDVAFQVRLKLATGRPGLDREEHVLDFLLISSGGPNGLAVHIVPLASEYLETKFAKEVIPGLLSPVKSLLGVNRIEAVPLPGSDWSRLRLKFDVRLYWNQPGEQRAPETYQLTIDGGRVEFPWDELLKSAVGRAKWQAEFLRNLLKAMFGEAAEPGPAADGFAISIELPVVEDTPANAIPIRIRVRGAAGEETITYFIDVFKDVPDLPADRNALPAPNRELFNRLIGGAIRAVRPTFTLLGVRGRLNSLRIEEILVDSVKEEVTILDVDVLFAGGNAVWPMSITLANKKPSKIRNGVRVILGTPRYGNRFTGGPGFNQGVGGLGVLAITPLGPPLHVPPPEGKLVLPTWFEQRYRITLNRITADTGKSGYEALNAEVVLRLEQDSVHGLKKIHLNGPKDQKDKDGVTVSRGMVMSDAGGKPMFKLRNTAIEVDLETLVVTANGIFDWYGPKEFPYPLQLIGDVRYVVPREQERTLAEAAPDPLAGLRDMLICDVRINLMGFAINTRPHDYLGIPFLRGRLFLDCAPNQRVAIGLLDNTLSNLEPLSFIKTTANAWVYVDLDATSAMVRLEGTAALDFSGDGKTPPKVDGVQLKLIVPENGRPQILARGRFEADSDDAKVTGVSLAVLSLDRSNWHPGKPKWENMKNDMRQFGRFPTKVGSAAVKWERLLRDDVQDSLRSGRALFEKFPLANNFVPGNGHGYEWRQLPQQGIQPIAAPKFSFRAIAYGRADRKEFFEEDLDIHLWIEKPYDGEFQTKTKVHFPENGQTAWRDTDIEFKGGESSGLFMKVVRELGRKFIVFLRDVYSAITQIPILGDLVGAIFGKPKVIACDCEDGVCAFDPRDFRKPGGMPGPDGYPEFDAPACAPGGGGIPGAPGDPGQIVGNPGDEKPGATNIANTPTTATDIITLPPMQPQDPAAATPPPGAGGGGITFLIENGNIIAVPAGSPRPEERVDITAYSNGVVTPASIGHPGRVRAVDAVLLNNLYEFQRAGSRVRVLERFSANPAPASDGAGGFAADPAYPDGSGPEAWVFDLLGADGQTTDSRIACLLIRYGTAPTGFASVGRISLPLATVGRPREELLRALKAAAVPSAGTVLPPAPGAPPAISRDGIRAATLPPHVVVTADGRAELRRGSAAPVVLANRVPDWVRPAVASQQYAVIPGSENPHEPKTSRPTGLAVWHEGQVGLFRPDKNFEAGSELASMSANRLAKLLGHPALAPMLDRAITEGKLPAAYAYPSAKEATYLVLESGTEKDERIALAGWTHTGFVVVVLNGTDVPKSAGAPELRTAWCKTAARAESLSRDPAAGLRLSGAGGLAFGPTEFGVMVELHRPDSTTIVRQLHSSALEFLRTAPSTLIDALVADLALEPRPDFVAFQLADRQKGAPEKDFVYTLTRSRNTRLEGQLVRLEGTVAARRTVDAASIAEGLKVVRPESGQGKSVQWLLDPLSLSDTTRQALSAEKVIVTRELIESLLTAAMTEPASPRNGYLRVRTLFTGASP